MPASHVQNGAIAKQSSRTHRILTDFTCSRTLCRSVALLRARYDNEQIRAATKHWVENNIYVRELFVRCKRVNRFTERHALHRKNIRDTRVKFHYCRSRVLYELGYVWSLKTQSRQIIEYYSSLYLSMVNIINYRFASRIVLARHWLESPFFLYCMTNLRLNESLTFWNATTFYCPQVKRIKTRNVV